MTLQVPAIDGSESIVGLTREAAWGTTPTTGADPNKVVSGLIFMPMKDDGIQSQLSVDPQTDDMVADREIQRIIKNGSTVRGGLRLTGGPESIGYFLTAIFGTPTTTLLAASNSEGEAAYQHIWYPALNTRANWPAPYSIESKYGASKSKLVQGALCERLNIDVPNNGAMSLSADFLAKKIVWLGAESGATDDRGNTLPAKVTASPTLLTENEFHWMDMVAYPQIDNVNQQSVTGVSFDLQLLGLEGMFTGGSGDTIGTYKVDNFQIGGRATILFEDEDLWEKFERGLEFELDVTFKGDLIQGSYYNQLQIIGYSCKANSDDVPNRVGALEYDFAWTGMQNAAQGKSCQVTLINTVSSYAAPS